MAEVIRLDIGVEASGDGHRMALKGPATLADASALAAQLAALPAKEPLTIDLSGLDRMDTAAAYAILSAEARSKEAGGRLELTGASSDISALIERVRKSLPKPEQETAPRLSIADRLERVGRTTTSALASFLDSIGYFGLFLARLVESIVIPSRFRLTALVHHCQEVGVKAVPIVALMSFLIGVVLAFQGSVQLRQFGAEVFVVDLIAISILRELGILLTAIIVAGRTASAFTAAIGSMKMREEIDAMRTLAIDPAAALFVPRILALLLMLPILGLIADVAGLLGGAIMSWVELGISPGMFQTRLLEGTDVRHVMVGLVKAPVFAIIIGVIGCQFGMKVESNAESLGRMTSSAVVAAIFAVIVADAIFSIFFAQIGV
ncbi:MlaE family lipid ABC transporter permease subunit [Rhodobacterales bacterium HKCCE3408]|nr:MlaE family lipid ABC transporter permease subunit [Rhodobacterales bacterium HKCCE3408]